jgi:hypothetical protein
MPESLPSNPTRWPGYSNEYEDGRGAIVVFVGLRAVRQLRSSRMRHGLPIEPALGWTYLSREALARAKAQMDEESMGVRDEIGFLTIHQRYADRFFPGTSVLHTRARYAIFVPWMFEDLAGLTGPAAVRALRERERELAGRLKVAGESQVIGGRVFPNPSSQPPSTVYWNALAVWGILRLRLDGRAISRAQAHRLLKGAGAATDDDGQPLLSFDPPFVTLPDRPDSWRGGPITLRLTTAEAVSARAACPVAPHGWQRGVPARPTGSDWGCRAVRNVGRRGPRGCRPRPGFAYSGATGSQPRGRGPRGL